MFTVGESWCFNTVFSVGESWCFTVFSVEIWLSELLPQTAMASDTSKLGVPSKLAENCLPTGIDIYNHYLYLRQAKIESGEWLQNTPLNVCVRDVTSDVCEQWDKTEIPYKLVGREGERKIMRLISRVQSEHRVPLEKRGEKFGEEFRTLFDIAHCHHKPCETCSCPEERKVPFTWKVFLADQRGPRELVGALSARTLTLRAAGVRSKEELEARERVRVMVEAKQRQGNRLLERREISRKETDTLLTKVPLSEALADIEDEVSESEEVEVMEIDGEDNDSDDSEWEDEEETKKDSKKDSGYNMMKLKNFARECDRYLVSDYAAAKIGNGLLKDIGLVKKGDSKRLICPSKVRRERRKWGGVLEKDHKSKKLPRGLYSDGKQCPTLVRDTVTTRVQVPGRRGRGAYKEVTTTSNKLYQQEHFVVIAEPSGAYVTHVTPDTGTGVSIATELMTVAREGEEKLELLGMDGCSVKTGIQNGVFRMVEVMLGYPVQHVVCLLHLNELPLRHLMITIDGTTSGPGLY